MKPKKNRSFKTKLWMIVLLLPVTVTIYILGIIGWQELQKIPESINFLKQDSTMDVPKEYITIYQDAEEVYGVPWTLLAAHHRIETKVFHNGTFAISGWGRRAYAIYALYICRLVSS